MLCSLYRGLLPLPDDLSGQGVRDHYVSMIVASVRGVDGVHSTPVLDPTIGKVHEFPGLPQRLLAGVDERPGEQYVPVVSQQVLLPLRGAEPPGRSLSFLVIRWSLIA